MVYIHEIDKAYYILAFMQLLVDAVETAFAMVLSADILELLYESAPYEEIRKPVISLLGLSFLLSLVSSVLKNEFVLPRRENIAKTYGGNLAAKFQQMDYSLIDSPYVKKLSDRIDKANNWGAGIYSLFWDLDA